MFRCYLSKYCEELTKRCAKLEHLKDISINGSMLSKFLANSEANGIFDVMTANPNIEFFELQAWKSKLINHNVVHLAQSL